MRRAAVPERATAVIVSWLMEVEGSIEGDWRRAPRGAKAAALNLQTRLKPADNRDMRAENAL